MIWIVIALYLLGALSVQLWWQEIGEAHALSPRWFVVGLLWPLVTLTVLLDGLLEAYHDLQRKEPPHA